jgi:acetyl esterase/lipase
MNRNEFLKALAGGAMSAVVRAQRTPQMPDPETIVYKTVQGCDIKLDVYRTGEGASRPGLMWIHGGALINGSRKQVGTPILPALVDKGYAVVSIDYRLAPESKLPAIIEDVRDAWRWIRTEGNRRFGIDPARLSVSGGSAGGYLTLMCGFCLESRPRSLVSYYGYGDIDGPWYAAPDEFYRRQPLVTKEEMLRGIAKSVVSEPPPERRQGNVYLYCRQQGIWPIEVTGHDPRKEPHWFDQYCPVRNVSKTYPPTLLIHGTADTDVPYAESKAMAARLAEVGVEHEFITVPGAGHGLGDAKPEEKAQFTQRAMEWIESHTKAA